MTERKFTDEEVIKALEHCTSSTTSEACKGCPFCNKDVCVEMDNALNIYALDLINRQRAEIADLQDENKGLKETNEHLSGEYIALSKEKDNLIRTYAECQKEAIKEFAERVKENRNRIFNTIYSDYHFSEIIDTLVKEMTEGKQ